MPSTHRSSGVSISWRICCAKSWPTLSRCSAEGEGDIAQLLDLIIIGDFVSLHMAAREGIDPGPVPVLGQLKHRLRQA